MIASYGVVLYAPLPPDVERGTSALARSLRAHRPELWIILAMAVLGALIALVTPMLTGKLLVEIIPRVDTSMWIAALGAMFLGALGSAVFEIVRALSLLRIEGPRRRASAGRDLEPVDRAARALLPRFHGWRSGGSGERHQPDPPAADQRDGGRLTGRACSRSSALRCCSTTAGPWRSWLVPCCWCSSA